MRSIALLGALACAAAWCAGCGGSRAPLPDTAPFTAAIDEYLKAGSMGMRVDAFESLDVSGDRATAKVRMADKEIGYGMRPVWEVTFEKSAEGWKVKEVKR